ncbi:MAG: hypothetical protein WC068_00355 [Caulobacter sp.]
MTQPAGLIRREAERNLALLGYGLLGVSIFFAGVTALVAVIIAYALRDAATEQLSSHFRLQIRIFWIGAACALLAVVGGLVAAFGALGNFLHQAPPADLVRHVVLWGNAIDLSGLRVTPLVVIAATVAVGAALLGAAWMIVAPTIGFIRLASSRHMGQTAHP